MSSDMRPVDSLPAVRALTGLSEQLGETPSGIQKTAVAEGPVAQAVGGGDPDDDLQARMNNLRR